MRPLTSLPTPLLALIATAFAAADVETTTLDSGLTIEYTIPATCSRPSQNGDEIAVHYKGTLQSNGEEFDESYRRGQPFTFALGQHRVIVGWDLGLLDMCPGEHRKLIIPPGLGYGDRSNGAIPGGSTLVFETELVDIVGVEQEDVKFVMVTVTEDAAVEMATATATLTQDAAFTVATATVVEEGAVTIATATATATEGAAFAIATAPSEPPVEDEKAIEEGVKNEEGEETSPEEPPERQAECRLLGPFALVVQGALGAVAVLSLVWKRYRETPKRPWKIFFFDVSKQVVGSMLTHILNLAMSMLPGAIDVVNAAATAATDSTNSDPERRRPNPCSYYLLNLGIDTTIGIPVLYVLLKILHAAFLHFPGYANPPESIKSGNYGHPPKTTWWLKQSLIYFIGLVGMKLFVFFLFKAMPWLPWIGDWALRWTKGNEALEVLFAMFIFPLVMNGVQYWVIDNFIMDKSNKGGGKDGYEAVHSQEDDSEVGRDDSFAEDGSSITHVEPDVQGKGQVEDGPLKEINPTPVPEREEGGSGEVSRRGTPRPKGVD